MTCDRRLESVGLDMRRRSGAELAAAMRRVQADMLAMTERRAAAGGALALFRLKLALIVPMLRLVWLAHALFFATRTTQKRGATVGADGDPK